MVNGILGSNKNPNQSRYIRLIVLSASQIITSLPISLFNLYANAFYLPVGPWISWDNTHYDYSRVNQFPSAVWRAGPTSGLLLDFSRWIVVIAALLFFAFFGFAEEARKHYRKAYSFATSSLRLSDSRKGSSRAGSASPPYTPSSSFGHSFKKGIATFSSFKNGFSALGSGSSSKSEIITTERKDSFLVSEYRLTSSASIFEGVDNSSAKASEISSPGDDDSKLAPAPAPTSRSAIEALAAVSNLPAPPPPIARVSVRSLPPGLYPAFPHSPTSSDLYFDPAEAV
jgi:pheromone a factor receptor